jgi:hypothetical protein
MVYQSSDFQGGKHNWSALANKSNRVVVERLIPARMIKQNGQDISDLRACKSRENHATLQIPEQSRKIQDLNY